MTNIIEAFGREIGDGKPCFIVAEAGSNHNGSVEIGKKLIEAAKESGADAIKFQAFKTEELVTKEAPKANYMGKTKEKNIFELLKGIELNESEHKELFDYAKQIGIPIFYSIFDKKSADFIEKLGVEVFKTGSGELTDLPLIEHIAKKNKPLIISTGMGDLNEIKEAVETAQKTGNKKIILMHCTTGYPCKKENANLNAIKTLKEEFKSSVGYSDHAKGIEVSLAAVMQGACIIEKHFTFDKNAEGPDHKMSTDRREFKRLIDCVREFEAGKKIAIKDLEIMLGSAEKKPTKDELKEMVWARKSIVARTNIKKGTAIKEEMLAVKRPGTGLSPKHYWSLIGKTTICTIKKDEQIKQNMLK